MVKNESRPAEENLDIMLEHLKSQDDGVYKDFTSLRDAFSREINSKEEKRHALMENIVQLEQSLDENLKKTEVLDKNNNIYEKNISEIETRQKNLTNRENWIKKNYSDIVSGSMSNPHKLLTTDDPNDLSNAFYNLFKENMKVNEGQVKSKLEELQSQKERFLGTLKNLFEQYDNELIAISEEKKDLNRLHDEIEGKRENAIHLKKELNNDNNTMKEQVENDNKDLEITEDEENKLIKEFQKILQRMRADINVSDITMDILFSSNKSNEKEKQPEEQQSVSEESAPSDEIAN